MEQLYDENAWSELKIVIHVAFLSSGIKREFQNLFWKRTSKTSKILCPLYVNKSAVNILNKLLISPSLLKVAGWSKLALVVAKLACKGSFNYLAKGDKKERRVTLLGRLVGKLRKRIVCLDKEHKIKKNN